MKSEELLARFGIAEDQLRLFRYRGYGNPGPTRIETEDGRAYEVSYQQLWEDESKWMIQPRCKICPDAIGEAADIVASGYVARRRTTGEDEGSTALLSALIAAASCSRPHRQRVPSLSSVRSTFEISILFSPIKCARNAPYGRAMRACRRRACRFHKRAGCESHPVPVSTVSRKISAKRAVPVIVPSRGGLGNRNPGRDEVS